MNMKITEDWRPAIDNLKDGDHCVQFYKDESFLFQGVGYYVAQALSRNNAVVVIATESHRKAFEEIITQEGFDVGELKHSNRFVSLDAQDALSKFMKKGELDSKVFLETIGEVIERVSLGGIRQVRAYGEMVNVLWHEGKVRQAIHLEELWNALANHHKFSLFCAYHLPRPEQNINGIGIHNICTAHTHSLTLEPHFTNDGVASAEQPQEKMNILVAEDDEHDYFFLKDVFTKFYPEVNLAWVKDGEELIDSLFNNDNPKPDCIILDLNMPRKDGRQALSEIRSEKAFEAVPILVLTTSGSPADYKFVSGFSRASFVTKPVGLANYVNLVKVIVTSVQR